MIGKTNSQSGGIIPTGTIMITSNGSYDVSNYATADVNISEGTERVPSPAFIVNSGNYALVSSATTVDDYRFYHDTKITSVSMPNVTNVGSNAFYYCTNITSIDMPNVTNVGSNAFTNCSKITSLNLPNLSYLGKSAFRDCTSLVNISLPKISTLSGDNFQGCNSLVNVDIPKVTSIPSTTFYNCSSLITIELPKVTDIKASAFSGCIRLATITLSSETLCTLSNKNALPADSSHHITIYVPSDLIASYQTATNWSTLYSNGYIDFQAITDNT